MNENLSLITENPIYKVLKDGKSCHGGSHAWSLPEFRDGQLVPGEWHEINGEPRLCSKGFHVTPLPGRWWLDGCSIYEVEVSGVAKLSGKELLLAVERGKIVVARIRLLRQVTRIDIEHGKWSITVDPSRSSGWSEPIRSK